MKNRIESIAQLFGTLKDTIIKEDFTKLECEVKLIIQQTPTDITLQSLLPACSDRDSWRLQMITDGDDDLFDLRAGINIADAYDKNHIIPYHGDEVSLMYTILKSKRNDIITVYDFNQFLNYIKELTITAAFNAIQNNLDEKLVVEIWSEQYERFYTGSIAFIKKDDAQTECIILNKDKERRKEKCKELCQWNNRFTNLTPEDFFIVDRETDSPLSLIFDQLSMLLSLCYVADFSSVDRNCLTLRLSGYKTMTIKSYMVKTEDMHFNTDSAKQWYKIYDWCYTGGYTSERLCIARNIISLNCSNTNELSLNALTLDAIKSNFKIFEKDNVRQYINVRNDISQTLLAMQEKVNAIVEGFTGDFHKSVISLGTFFLTVMVVRVIAKGDITGGFTGNIVLLSFAFIVLSFVNLIYSRMLLERKEKLFTKHYEQLKDRYSQLLSEEEIQKVFEDSDPKKVGTHANYIQWQKNRYTWIWAIALLVFALLLVLMWCYNLFETSNVVKIFKMIIKCYTRNT